MLITCLANVMHKARPWADSGEEWPPRPVSLRLCWWRSIPEQGKPSTWSWFEHLRWDLPRAEGGDGRSRDERENQNQGWGAGRWRTMGDRLREVEETNTHLLGSWDNNFSYSSPAKVLLCKGQLLFKKKENYSRTQVREESSRMGNRMHQNLWACVRGNTLFIQFYYIYMHAHIYMCVDKHINTYCNMYVNTSIYIYTSYIYIWTILTQSCSQQ